MNQIIPVKVQATKDFLELHAVVIGRSGIVLSRVFTGLSRFSENFNLTTTPEMLPDATLFVYYFQPTGEIIFDRLALSFDKALPNKVRSCSQKTSCQF